MEHLINQLIAQYGLLAVFVGCLAEGETAALLGGLFAHQRVFALWQTALVAFCGATLGDTGFFLIGRHLSRHPWVLRLRQRPEFSRAQQVVQRHPNLFVLANRYVYGMRLIGGVAAGLAEIRPARFMLLNAASALVWALLFSTLGYLFGLGAEEFLGRALHMHQRLWLALAVVLVMGAFAWFTRLRRARRAGRCVSVVHHET